MQIKRVYEAPSRDDGRRILCDRLWPRGLTKEAARVTKWVKELAPSRELAEWFHVNPEARWDGFVKKYRAEIAGADSPLRESAKKLAKLAADHNITLVYASKNTKYNNARALRLILSRLAR